MILSHFSGAAVPFWWCSQVRVAKMVFMAVVNYQTQCRRRHRRQKRILKAVMLFTAAIRRQCSWATVAAALTRNWWRGLSRRRWRRWCRGLKLQLDSRLAPPWCKCKCHSLASFLELFKEAEDLLKLRLHFSARFLKLENRQKLGSSLFNDQSIQSSIDLMFNSVQ